MYAIAMQGLECCVSCSVTDDKSLNFFDITPKVAGTIQEQHISINRLIILPIVVTMLRTIVGNESC